MKEMLESLKRNMKVILTCVTLGFFLLMIRQLLPGPLHYNEYRSSEYSLVDVAVTNSATSDTDRADSDSQESSALWIYSAINDLLMALGSGLIVLGGATVIYDHMVVSRGLHRMFSILGASSSSGIEMMYSNRSDSYRATYDALRSARGTVRIMAIAMTDFLQSERGKNLIEDTAKHTDLRCILLHPASEEAMYRAGLESGEQRILYRDTELFRNIESAVANLNILEAVSQDGGGRENKGSVRTVGVGARFALREPTLYTIITNSAVLFEPYHLGANPSDQRARALTLCLGKHIPVIQVPAQSELGKTFENYFDEEWRRWSSRDCDLGAVSNWIKEERKKAVEDAIELPVLPPCVLSGSAGSATAKTRKGARKAGARKRGKKKGRA